MSRHPKRKHSEVTEIIDLCSDSEREMTPPGTPGIPSTNVESVAPSKYSTPEPNAQDNKEENDDHNCPLCHCLLYRPVTTPCSHHFCQSCIERYYETRFTITKIQEGSGETVKPCPICRTIIPKSVTANLNEQLHTTLLAIYGNVYRERRDEIVKEEREREERQAVYKKFLIGNVHTLIDGEPQGRVGNQHKWRFFIRMETPADEETYIDRVEFQLHPTFNPPTLILTHPPFELTRLGWGIFVVKAHVYLKRPYILGPSSSKLPQAVDADQLMFGWMLDFNGQGSLAEFEVEIVRDTTGVREERSRQIRSENQTRRFVTLLEEYANDDDDETDEFEPAEESDVEEEFDEEFMYDATESEGEDADDEGDGGDHFGG